MNEEDPRKATIWREDGHILLEIHDISLSVSTITFEDEHDILQFAGSVIALTNKLMMENGIQRFWEDFGNQNRN